MLNDRAIENLKMESIHLVDEFLKGKISNVVTNLRECTQSKAMSLIMYMSMQLTPEQIDQLADYILDGSS